MRPDLPTFFGEMHRDGASFRQVVRAAVERGFHLPELLDRVDFDECPGVLPTADGPRLVFDWGDEGWLDVLAEELGGDEAVQAVLDQACGWMTERPVAGWRAMWAALGELDRAANARDPARLDAAVAQARELVDPASLAATLRTALDTWPLELLVPLRSLPVELGRARFPLRGPWHELLDRVEERLGPQVASEWIGRTLGPPEWRSSDPDLRYLQVAGDLRRELCQSLFEPFARVGRRRPPTLWLGEAHSSGLPASQALLLVLDSGTKVGDAVAQLAGAGWADAEILHALRENGVGITPALAALQGAGWQASRLVESLRAQGLLEPEVREMLRELGFGPEVVERWMCTAVGRGGASIE